MRRIIGQDRFFAYADRSLVDQVGRAAIEGEFTPEPSPGSFHPDATSSFKQIQFGEANVQLTFHEKDAKTIGGVECVKVEPDIDYFQDLGAHTLLDVIPNAFTHGLTDPKEVYVLRWIAGRHAGVPEFAPPYTIGVEAFNRVQFSTARSVTSQDPHVLQLFKVLESADRCELRLFVKPGGRYLRDGNPRGKILAQ